jgi:hypothetical protein
MAGGDLPQPNPVLLERLRRARQDPLDSMTESEDGKQALRGLKQALRPGDQAALFRRLGPLARIPESDFAARDVANISWSTKLARRYFIHLGARCVSVKPWALHALRCMFNIRKDRTDLRNHAVDAFLAAHFDERVMNPAFAALRGSGYEALYDPRPLEEALAKHPDTFDAIRENLTRLSAVLKTIATAHRPDNQWNPGDAPDGSFGALGGQNIYAFRPDAEALAAIGRTIALVQGQRDMAVTPTKKEIAKLLTSQPNDPGNIRLQHDLAKKVKLRYRDRKAENPKATSLNFETALPIKNQPNAYIDSEGKFAIASATKISEREVISIAAFSKADSASRARYFERGRIIYRSGDTVISNGRAYVITGLEADGRLTTYPIDAAEKKNNEKFRPSVPNTTGKAPPQRIRSDVLGRRLHRRRKTAGDLEPVPYKLFDE